MPEHCRCPLRCRHKADEDGPDGQQTLLDGNAHRGHVTLAFRAI